MQPSQWAHLDTAPDCKRTERGIYAASLWASPQANGLVHAIPTLKRPEGRAPGAVSRCTHSQRINYSRLNLPAREDLPGAISLGIIRTSCSATARCVNGAHDLVPRHLRVRIGVNMKHDAGNNLLFYLGGQLGTARTGGQHQRLD